MAEGRHTVPGHSTGLVFGSICPIAFLPHNCARLAESQAASGFQLQLQELQPRSPFEEGLSYPVQTGREASSPWALPHYVDTKGSSFFG